MWVASEQWVMEQVAYDIPRGVATGRQCRAAAVSFERIAERLRAYADEVEGVTVVEGGGDG